jgi:hypothetical protein
MCSFAMPTSALTQPGPVDEKPFVRAQSRGLYVVLAIWIRVVYGDDVELRRTKECQRDGEKGDDVMLPGHIFVHQGSNQ